MKSSNIRETDRDRLVKEMSCSDGVGWMLYVELQDQWNGPYFFFLKSIAQPPVNETAPIFFSRGVFPSYYHVISDFCHIWGPFMAKIEKMCQKSAFLVVPSQNH